MKAIAILIWTPLLSLLPFFFALGETPATRGGKTTPERETKIDITPGGEIKPPITLASRPSRPPTQRSTIVRTGNMGFGVCPNQAGIIHGSLLNGYAFCTAEDAGFVASTPEDIILEEETDRGSKCYGIAPGLPLDLIGPAEFYSFIEKYTNGRLDQHQPDEAPFGVPGKTNIVHVQIIWQSHAHGTGGPGPRTQIDQTAVDLSVMYQVMEDGNRVTKEKDLMTAGTKVCSQTTPGGDTPTTPIIHSDAWTVSLPPGETPSLIYFAGRVPLMSGELFFADATLTIKNSPASN